MAISPALPRPSAHAWPMDGLPDPEVAERPTRRRFTAAYKVAILDELDRATTPGSKGAILRREGLYSSHVTDWRRLRALGGLEALGRSRGPKAAHPLVAENERLRATVGRLEARLTRAEKVIAVQGNVSALLRELSLESAETFPWTAITFSARVSRASSRPTVARRRSFSATSGWAALGPRDRPRASRPPSARRRRQSVTWLPYRPSRRRMAPLEPGVVARSSSSRMATLYAAVKRRRVGRSATSGSGSLSIDQACAPGRGRAGEMAMTGTPPYPPSFSDQGRPGVSPNLGREGIPSS